MYNGLQFTTRDQDNDRSSANCAVRGHGAWWYAACAYSNLNGEYGGPGLYDVKYNTWYHWKKNKQSLKVTTMMVRPKI
jgi:hypothetical protein